MAAYIHPTAVIDDGASIGEGSKVWHFCHLMSGCNIGKNCILGQNVFVAPKVTVGDGTKIQNNVSLYEGVICEKNVFIGPSAVFTNVFNPRANIERKEEFRQTLVKEGATIGANATIVCGITIGRYAFIGAGSVITKDVPDFALYFGNPGRHRAWVSKRGEKLNFRIGATAKCSISGEEYRLSEGRVICVSDLII